MNSFDILAETLTQNPTENWADILSKYFHVDFSLVETIVDAYNEMPSERFSELMNEADGMRADFYTQYLGGQTIDVSEEDRLYALEVEKKVLTQIEKYETHNSF